MSNSTPFVIFGYGSLIWKPPPHTIARVPGFIKGYVRRFAQKSHDHRGTLENPGRVVTLIHSSEWDKFSSTDPFPEENLVWGVAYTIDPAYEALVRDYLDYREKDGYTLETLDIFGIDDERQDKIIIHDAFCYVGRSDNPSFAGSEPFKALVKIIHETVGPSGPNKEYLYELAKSVRTLCPDSHDPYLQTLEDRVRELDELELREGS